MKSKLAPLLLTALWLACSLSAHADGPGGYRPREGGIAPTSELEAIDAYNAGYALILRADHAQNLAGASSDRRERAASLAEARETYQASLQLFAQATTFDASMHEAYTYIGYANRKLGRHEDALAAYRRALDINPDYPYAIEYQGEAYLGLNRVDDARFNYLRLYALDARQASKLFLAMQSWYATNRSKPPKGVDMDALAAWLADRSSSSERDAVKNAASSW